MALRTQPGSRYRWNATARRYVDARGRFVSSRVVRLELDAALQRATIRIRVLALQLRDGAITLPEWEIGMRGLAKEVHVYSATAARGGFAQMTPAEYGRVGRIVRDQYAFIRNFRNEIADGKPTDGRFLARTALYAQAGRETYHLTERQVELEKGNVLERNILAAADHCAADAARGTAGCPGETARGWVLIGSLVPIGQRTCTKNCKCTIEYSTVNALADAAAPKDVPKPKPDSPYRAKYAMALMDIETCDHCAAFDGVVVAVDDPRQLPDHGCTSKRGCQCTWVYIRKEEIAEDDG